MKYWIVSYCGEDVVGPDRSGNPVLYTDLADAWIFAEEANARVLEARLADEVSLMFFAREVEVHSVRRALVESDIAPIIDEYLGQADEARCRWLNFIVSTRGLRDQISEVRSHDGEPAASLLLSLVT